MRNQVHRIAKRLFLETLAELDDGFLMIHSVDGIEQIGDPASGIRAAIQIHDERFFSRAIFGGDIGIGESFMAGEWSTDDLVSVVRIAVRNLSRLETSNRLTALLNRLVDTIRHRRNANTVKGSQRNIHAHYDLSNDFFSLFLDESMTYSAAWFESADETLESAQRSKLDRICRKLQLDPGDHVLEIGTGWGSFALHAAREYGCRVTTTTISQEQFDLATDRIEAAGLDDRIHVLLEDYRSLSGRYDKIASIEMFEAVGYDHYDEFFSAADRLLHRDGTMLLQTITMTDQSFDAYRRRADWIQKHIFPGGELASVSGVFASLARSTDLALFQAEDMGAHYARTLREWRRRFHRSRRQARLSGFDETFLRGWDYYLAYCEGAFLERHVSVMQFLLTKTHSRRNLLNEPWETSAPKLHLVAEGEMNGRPHLLASRPGKGVS